MFKNTRQFSTAGVYRVSKNTRQFSLEVYRVSKNNRQFRTEAIYRVSKNTRQLNTAGVQGV